MAISKSLNVNGKRVTIQIDDPEMPLLYALRRLDQNEIARVQDRVVGDLRDDAGLTAALSGVEQMPLIFIQRIGGQIGGGVE